MAETILSHGHNPLQCAARPLLSSPSLMIMFIDTAPERDANGRGGGVERKGIEQRARKLQQWEKGERKQKYPRPRPSVRRRVRSVINRFLFEAALRIAPFLREEIQTVLAG